MQRNHAILVIHVFRLDTISPERQDLYTRYERMRRWRYEPCVRPDVSYSNI